MNLQFGKPVRLIFSGIALLALLFFLIFGFRWHTDLELIQKQGVLNVSVLPSPVFLNITPSGSDGFEYELLQEFADYLGVELRIRVLPDLPTLLTELQQSLDPMAAAGLSYSLVPFNLQYSNAIFEVSRVLIYRKSGTRTLNHLAGERILVREHSPAHDWLRQQPQDFQILTASGSSRDILDLLNDGVASAAVIDSIEFDYDSDYFPELKIAEDISDPVAIRWLFSSRSDSSLRDSANNFLSQANANGTMEQLIERYFGTLNRLTYSGVNIFQKAIEDQLPLYRETFEQAAIEQELDWRLLAAIGYQESHWRKRAVSPTGVRGIMMLTQATARLMGVKQRMDPIQSIQGGAKYFKRMLSVIPEHIQEPDRSWFALAAYNVGSGHLRDARKLTFQMGKNPDIWLDVKEHLPLLEQKEYYQNLEFGRARGSEPVKYVQNIRRYYEILRWNFPNEGEQIDPPEELKEMQALPIYFPSGI